MPRWLAGILGVAGLLGCLVVPVGLAVRQQHHIRNFHVVRPGVLYRSAQLDGAGLRRLVNDYRIRTVVNLRDGIALLDRDEEEFCGREEIRFVRLLPRSWDGEAGTAPVFCVPR